MTNVFKFSKDTFVNARSKYDPLTKLVYALTNFHILNMPLRIEEIPTDIYVDEDYAYTWMFDVFPAEE